MKLGSGVLVVLFSILFSGCTILGTKDPIDISKESERLSKQLVGHKVALAAKDGKYTYNNKQTKESSYYSYYVELARGETQLKNTFKSMGVEVIPATQVGAQDILVEYTWTYSNDADGATLCATGILSHVTAFIIPGWCPFDLSLYTVVHKGGKKIFDNIYSANAYHVFSILLLPISPFTPDENQAWVHMRQALINQFIKDLESEEVLNDV